MLATRRSLMVEMMAPDLDTTDLPSVGVVPLCVLFCHDGVLSVEQSPDDKPDIYPLHPIS